jgi:hypothetical protein
MHLNIKPLMKYISGLDDTYYNCDITILRSTESLAETLSDCVKVRVNRTFLTMTLRASGMLGYRVDKYCFMCSLTVFNRLNYATLHFKGSQRSVKTCRKCYTERSLNMELLLQLLLMQ